MKYLDPRAAMIGGACVLVSLAANVPAPAAFAIGVVTLGVANVGHVRAVRQPVVPPRPELLPDPEPVLHPEERRWIQHAEDAVSTIRHGVRTLDGGPLRERLLDVAAHAEGVLDDLRRVAAQVTATRRASSQLDLPQLSTDLSRLTSTLEHSDDQEVVRDLQRSVDAVREQLRIGRRLSSARVGLQTRIEAGTLGLQQLAAQVSEMTALAPPGGGTWQHADLIDELTMQLEALRAGLNDAGAMSRRALGAMDPEGGDDVPATP